MNRKRAIVLVSALLILLTAAASAQDQEKPGLQRTFKIIKEYWRSPVKSQGATGTCYSFSAMSFFESEAKRLGKGEFELSPMFPHYFCYIEKAERYVRMHGNNTFGQGGLDHDIFWAIERYGLAPADAYTALWPYEQDRHNHSELERALEGYLDGVIGGRGPTPKWRDGFIEMLNVYLGKPPEKITVGGNEMTPKQFAEDALGIHLEDYIGMTSFTHLPLYELCELLVEDNWLHGDETFNVTLDEAVAVVDNALMNGYTVLLGCDVSERGWHTDQGFAVMPEDQKGEVVSAEQREAMWDDWSTTDDHGMHIVGIAEDEKGRKFYLLKNSWGQSAGPFGGDIYISENYFRAKFDSILVHKDAVPQNVLSKLKTAQ